MALLADRVKETTTTTGTGTVSLAGAPAGFQSFNTAFANGSLVYYVIQGGAEWEIGIGTTGTGTLARTQVLQSSNADALVPFSAGVKDVFCSYVADRAVTTVDAATLTNKTIDDYTNNVGANSTHFRIKATGTISKGTVVKATGYNPGEQAIEVAVVTSATDLVLGISEQALTAGQFGLAVVIGELFNVNTNGFTVGNIIYSNGSGGFTETKPSSGLYQALGWIVRANASNGVIAVNVVAPLYVETATNTANTSVLRDGSGNFSAGTITATLSGTATQVSNALTAGTYLTSGGTYNGSAARTFAVDATDANTASKVVARDASGNFSAGTITATLNGAAPAGSLSGTTLAANVVTSSLTSVGTLTSGAIGAGFTAIPDSALSTISTAGKVSNSATTAASANTANAIVARDASGNFAAGTITAALAGNATTATTADKVANALTAGTYLTSAGTFDGSAARTFAVDATDANTASKVVARDGSGNFSAGTITANLSGTATQVSQALTAGSYLTSTGTYNGGTARTFAVDATDANTASKVVARDASGNFSAGTITATLNGAAPAGSLSGTTLASGVTASSLTSVGTLSSLTVSGAITGATATNTINGLVINSGGLGGATGIKFGIGAAFSTGQAEAYTTSTTPMGIGTVGAQPLRFYANSALVGSFDSSGNLAVDTNTLYVDAANNRVGVGTTSPASAWSGDAVGVQVAASGATAAFSRVVSANGSAELVVSGATSVWGLYSGSNIPFALYTNNAERLRVDTSGNLGLGVTPVQFSSGRTNLQVHGTTQPNIVFSGNPGNGGCIWTNAYYDGVSDKYIATGAASRFATANGAFLFDTAPSGSAGATATFTRAMTLNASGNLGIGTASPQEYSGYTVLSVDNATNGGVVSLRKNGTVYGNVSATNNNMTIDAVEASASIVFRSGAGSTERARIDSSGNFGIGIASPATRLDVRGSSAATIRVGSTGNGASGDEFGNLEFYWGDPDAAEVKAKIYAKNVGNVGPSGGGAADLLFATTPAFGSSTERARITSGGNWLVGTTTSLSASTHTISTNTANSRALDVINATATNPYGVQVYFSGASPDDNSKYFLVCSDTTTQRCYIWSDGDLANHDGVYGTISDAALKQDIIDATSQWADMKAVRFRKYRMKTDVAADANAPYQLGVIAQELEATSPGLVDEHPNEDGTTTKTVKSSILLMKAAVALQEAMARIETLEQRVLALEA